MRREVIVGANLSLGYQSGKSRKEVLQGINFKLFSGELTCLLGPNGVGKSTLIKAIMGRLPVWEGTLTVQGKSINQFTQKELAKNLAVVLTEPFIPGNMTVTQLVSLGRTPYLNWSGYLSDLDKKAVYKAIEDTKIAYIQHERLSDLSDGQRQKAFIARALAQDAPIMVLDEPTAHLDLVNRYEIMQLLREISLQKGKCVLVITHDLDIALESSDQIWLMNCGEDLVKGLPEDMVISGNINHLFPQEKFEFNT
ncbi:MAG TPA: ABC transporter ATP-binding protein, partial [Algoriphagus sp.]|nr:ABC transporter ATP-binding protein [Algoriphagus sp.]